MQQALKSWLILAAVLCTALLVDEWLALSQSPAAFGRAALVIGLATALNWYWPRASSARTDPEPSAMPGVTDGIIPPVGDENLLKEVALAIEHIRSIRALLEISQTHRQPIPLAVPHNLALVAKHLDNAQHQLRAERAETLAAISETVAHRPSLRLSGSVREKE
jgi:hypothetical protein